MENKNPEMSYLIGRAHSEGLTPGAEAAEILIRLPSDNAPKSNTKAWHPMKKNARAERD